MVPPALRTQVLRQMSDEERAWHVIHTTLSRRPYKPKPRKKVTFVPHVIVIIDDYERGNPDTTSQEPMDPDIPIPSIERSLSPLLRDHRKGARLEDADEHEENQGLPPNFNTNRQPPVPPTPPRERSHKRHISIASYECEQSPSLSPVSRNQSSACLPPTLRSGKRHQTVFSPSQVEPEQVIPPPLSFNKRAVSPTPLVWREGKRCRIEFDYEQELSLPSRYAPTSRCSGKRRQHSDTPSLPTQQDCKRSRLESGYEPDQQPLRDFNEGGDSLTSSTQQARKRCRVSPEFEEQSALPVISSLPRNSGKRQEESIPLSPPPTPAKQQALIPVLHRLLPSPLLATAPKRTQIRLMKMSHPVGDLYSASSSPTPAQKLQPSTFDPPLPSPSPPSKWTINRPPRIPPTTAEFSARWDDIAMGMGGRGTRAKDRERKMMRVREYWAVPEESGIQVYGRVAVTESREWVERGC